MAYRIELLSGILAAIFGLLVAAAILAFGTAAWAAVAIGLGGIGAGIGAYQDSHGRGKPWLALLWVSALALLVMTILAIFSIWILLLPGALGALVAAGVGTWRSAKS